MCFNTHYSYLRCVSASYKLIRAVKLFNILRKAFHSSSSAMKSVLKTLPLKIGLLVFAIKAVDPASLIGGESVKWLEWKSMHEKVYADSYEESFRRAIWSYNSKVRMNKYIYIKHELPDSKVCYESPNSDQFRST